jgi:amino acid transporter
MARLNQERREIQADAHTLEHFHYRQELQRTLRFFGSFAVAFSFISITTGTFTNYGFVLKTGGPAGIWSWAIAAVGQLLVALVFADLARQIPLTGYSYQWVTRLTNAGLGWMAGWLGFAFLVLVAPAVNGGLAPVVLGLLRLEQTPTILKIITIAALTLQVFLNIRGVQWATMINNIAVFSEAIGMIGLLILLAIAAFVQGNPSVDLLFQAKAGADGSYVGPFMLSMLIGLFTLVGFEAAANLSEETINARQTVPKAIISSVILSSVVGLLFLVCATIAIPNLENVMASDNPLPFIISSRLGPLVGTFFLLLVVVSIFACGLVIVTSASRLIYALARDNVFFGNQQLRQVTRTDGVPANAVLLVWVLGAFGVLFSDSLTTLVGTTSVLPAMIYLLTVLAYRFNNGRALTEQPRGWRIWVANAAIVWLIFGIGVLTIPPDFNKIGYLCAAITAVGIILYHLAIRPRIRAGQAGVQLEPLPEVIRD